ncbi:uncharacterized protein LOC113351987 [Papaver somniferum]|uniref:uncharacterized protein LOC113351987 n=1 Tax=Papaver somniferum TaxID=3469 RepID=UPI000E705385|nr:uncharacterized protein LOC113351987 [Papaver somniferum]
MKVNGDTIEDSAIVEKILRSLPEKFESKVTAIEECNTAATMTLNELLGLLQAYEQRLLEKTAAAKTVEEALQSQVRWTNNQGNSSFGGRSNNGSYQRRYNFGGRSNNGGYEGRKLVDKAKLQCDNNCGNFGHFSFDCPKPRKTTENNYKANFKANIAESQEEEEEEEEEEQKAENMLLSCHTAEKQPQLKCSTIPVMGKGRIGIVLKNGSKAYIMDVFDVPGLHQNLLSMGQLSERGYSMNI